MNLHSPTWWQGNTHHLLPKYLSPVGFLYGKIVEARFGITKPYHSNLPVICVGNFTLGGTGKTPLCIKLCEILKHLGHQPSFLSRGYKGKYSGPLLVNKEEHGAKEVGDEPLLLADHAPTIIAKNRIDGAWLIEQRKGDFIIMDDGFQNPQIHMNVSLIAIDHDFLLGNERIFPAGPLRASLAFQLPKADAIIFSGIQNSILETDKNSETPFTKKLRNDYGFKGPILRGGLSPISETDWLADKPILAFAGIGRPDKFFNSLTKAGGNLIRRQPFPDHHNYTEKDAASLIELALRDDLQLITTEKDMARLSETEGRHKRALKRMSRAFSIEFAFINNDEQKLIELIKSQFPKK